ncbi:MAG: molybdopterin-dependent oxidoreductase [Anaerolineales bacterium]|nr:molybdopterin-dependent oxidoreductase [Anaerolineales bacterium]
MKKSLLILFCLVIVASLIVGCGGASESKGPTILKVTGKIADGTYEFDEATFDKNAVDQEYVDPWVGDGTEPQKYNGVMLSKLIEIVKPTSDATTISVIATDGKGIDVSMADAQKWPIMLVHRNAGAALDEKTGGPVKIAFPQEARDTYLDEQWMWWVVEIKFK